jgi:flagellar basal-body rod modification protein FlgD
MEVTNTVVSAAAGAGSTDKSKAAAGNAIDNLANKETFLQLLVAQIKNQNPLQPTDGVQFVTQLAQFSSLEQLVAIRGEITSLTPAAPTTVTGNSGV